VNYLRVLVMHYGGCIYVDEVHECHG